LLGISYPNTMKLLFTLLLAGASLTAAAQTQTTGYAALPKDSITHKVVYTGVVPVAGATKADLVSRAQEWGARAFVDSKAANQVIDKEAGTLLYHGKISSTKSGGFGDGGTTFGFTLAIYVKDGRYKYLVDEFTDSPHIPANSLTTPVERWEKFAGRGWAVSRSNELNTHITTLITNLRQAMAGKVGGAGDF
jgi:hypothetical protein